MLPPLPQTSPLWPLRLTFHCWPTLCSTSMMPPSLLLCRLRRTACTYNWVNCLKLSRQQGSERHWRRLAVKARAFPTMLNTQFIFLYDFMLRLELQPFILVGAFQFALCVVEGSLFCRYAWDNILFCTAIVVSWSILHFWQKSPHLLPAGPISHF